MIKFEKYGLELLKRSMSTLDINECSGIYKCIMGDECSGKCRECPKTLFNFLISDCTGHFLLTKFDYEMLVELAKIYNFVIVGSDGLVRFHASQMSAEFSTERLKGLRGKGMQRIDEILDNYEIVEEC